MLYQVDTRKSPADDQNLFWRVIAHFFTIFVDALIFFSQPFLHLFLSNPPVWMQILKTVTDFLPIFESNQKNPLLSGSGENSYADLSYFS
jgi:hypothetical protein